MFQEYLQLVWTFFQLGIMTFGGGYAMLPMLRREIVEHLGWATEEEILDFYAIGQCTPGIIAVNLATFIGYKRRGVPGAILATAGLVLPSLLIISIIALLLRSFGEYAAVQHAFAGIRVAVGVLVLQAVIKLFRSGVRGGLSLGLFLGAVVAAAIFDVSPVWIVLVALLLGLLCGRLQKEGR